MARRTGHHRRTHLDGLTGRQREVLEQMALGKTNLEIAESLGIGFESVKSHVSDILLRLEVSSREEAIIAWEDRGGVLSRLRRTATGFVLTGFGKAATAGVAGILAVGVVVANFAMSRGGESAEGQFQTYLLDDGREVNQALAELEASDFVGFEVVKPAGEEWRLARPSYFPTTSSILTGGERNTSITVRNAEGRYYSVRQFNSETDTIFRRTDPTRTEERINSGRPGIEVLLIVSATEFRYAAWGRGRRFEVSDPRREGDHAEALEIIFAFFDAAPDPLPPPPPSGPNPNRTPGTPFENPRPEIVEGMTGGTDYEFAGRDQEDVRLAASQDAGFEVALPALLPSGTSFSLVRIPPVTANQDLRAAYLSLVNDDWRTGHALIQYGGEIADPGEWGQRIDSGHAEIAAWEIGDFRNPDATARTFMAVGNGRTAALMILREYSDEGLPLPTYEMIAEDAIGLLVSTLLAAP